jgi:hypothetical protein
MNWPARTRVLPIPFLPPLRGGSRMPPRGASRTGPTSHPDDIDTGDSLRA